MYQYSNNLCFKEQTITGIKKQVKTGTIFKTHGLDKCVKIQHL